MAQIPPTTDRDEIVEIVSNFYTFLTTHPFLPGSSLKTPPSGGWPEEYREVWRKMGRSEEVIDLLSHLPYIDDANWHWFHETIPINYISSLNLRRINDNWESKRYLFEPPEQILPPNVFSLTNGRLYGIWVLLDVQAGTITEFSYYNSPPGQNSQVQAEGGSKWHLFPTKTIREFFEACQRKMEGGSLSTG